MPFGSKKFIGSRRVLSEGQWSFSGSSTSPEQQYFKNTSVSSDPDNIIYSRYGADAGETAWGSQMDVVVLDQTINKYDVYVKGGGATFTGVAVNSPSATCDIIIGYAGLAVNQGGYYPWAAGINTWKPGSQSVYNTFSLRNTGLTITQPGSYYYSFTFPTVWTKAFRLFSTPASHLNNGPAQDTAVGIFGGYYAPTVTVAQGSDPRSGSCSIKVVKII